MKVRFTLANFKSNLDDRIEPLDFLSEMIAVNIKNQAVNPCTENFVFGQQLSAAAIRGGSRRRQYLPCATKHSPLKAHWDVFRGLTLSGVQHVG